MKFLFITVSALVGSVLLSGCDSKYIWGHSFVNERFAGIPDEMFYQTKGTCEKGDLGFQVLMGGGAILWDVPQTQSEDDILTGQVYIYLNRDNTYTVNYREYNFANNLIVEKEFTSSHSFDSENQLLTLNDLGVASIFKRRNRYYLRLTFTTNLNSNLLQGQTIEVWLRSSIKGLNEDRQDYCP